MFDGILTVIGLAFLLFGLFVFFSAVLGLYRLDYVLNRMHAAAVGDALGLTEGLGLGCTIVSALLEQAVNRPTPTREITRRIQILFKAVRLLAAIVCRSETAYLRQSLPDLRIKMERTALLETVRQGGGNFLQSNFMREGFAPSAGFMI